MACSLACWCVWVCSGVDLQTTYSEGLLVGYRWYNAMVSQSGSQVASQRALAACVWACQRHTNDMPSSLPACLRPSHVLICLPACLPYWSTIRACLRSSPSATASPTPPSTTPASR